MRLPAGPAVLAEAIAAMRFEAASDLTRAQNHMAELVKAGVPATRADAEMLRAAQERWSRVRLVGKVAGG